MEVVKVKLKPGHPDRAMNIRLKDDAVVRINEQGVDIEADRIDAADLRRLSRYVDVVPVESKTGKNSAGQEEDSKPKGDPDKGSPDPKEEKPKKAAKSSKKAK